MAYVREMTITYGTQVIPGAVGGANVTLVNVHKLTKDDARFEVEFDILVDGLGSPATLAAAAVALETTFTTRRLALTVALSGNNALTADDAVRSGLDVTPTIQKVGDLDPPDRYDTNTSRMYRVLISGGLPALGVANRAVFGYDVSFSPSRRTSLSVTGTYTATSGGAGATATYQGLIAARVATITGALGGAFELVEETYSPDDVDGFVSFSRVYKEILVVQAAGLLNHPAIVDPNLEVTRDAVTDEGTGEGSPLVTIEATYATGVDFTVDPNLQNVWDTVCLPLIALQMEVVAGGGVALTSIRPRFDPYRHTISATVLGETLGEGQVLSKTVETLDEVDYGKIVRDVWPRPDDTPADEQSSSPRPGAAHVYQSARVITRQITTVTEEVVTAEVDEGAVANRNARTVGAVAEIDEIDDATFTSVRMTRATRSKRKTRGIASAGSTIPVLERTVIETFRVILPILAAGVAQGGGQAVGGDANRGGAGGRN